MSRIAAPPLRAFSLPLDGLVFEGRINTRKRRSLRAVARTLPRTPGVYFFHGYQDRLLYVGKANCLRERVGWYFAETKQRRSTKLRRLLCEIERLDFQQCGSELEALLLERRLIAERRPILNRQLKRFEVYPYLLLSDETFPRLTVTRAEPIPGDSLSAAEAAPPPLSNAPLETPPRAGEIPGLYLGPFTSPRHAFSTFETVRNIFPLRSCEGGITPDAQGKACIYLEIGRCAGPCVEASSAQQYGDLVANLLSMLHHGEAPQLQKLKARMERLADEWKFEEAGRLKEQIEGIEEIAARLQRLNRIREQNNVAIVQRALYGADEPSCANVFLVQGGVVRRHLRVSDWDAEGEGVREAIRDIFAAPPPVRPFTAKEELDEMLILDRWLQTHGSELCCAWLSPETLTSHAWAGNAVRRLRAWARRNIT